MNTQNHGFEGLASSVDAQKETPSWSLPRPVKAAFAAVIISSCAPVNQGITRVDSGPITREEAARRGIDLNDGEPAALQLYASSESGDHTFSGTITDIASARVPANLEVPEGHNVHVTLWISAKDQAVFIDEVTVQRADGTFAPIRGYVLDNHGLRLPTGDLQQNLRVEAGTNEPLYVVLPDGAGAGKFSVTVRAYNETEEGKPFTLRGLSYAPQGETAR